MLTILFIFIGFVKSTREIKDRSEDNLFYWVDEDRVFSRPTYKGKRDQDISTIAAKAKQIYKKESTKFFNSHNDQC